MKENEQSTQSASTDQPPCGSRRAEKLQSEFQGRLKPVQRRGPLKVDEMAVPSDLNLIGTSSAAERLNVTLSPKNGKGQTDSRKYHMRMQCSTAIT
jgi:hypothetical protein